MRPETLADAGYFDTPARAERLQLLAHLMRNAATPVYLRGPGGAGKTDFADRLRTALAEDAVVARIDLSEPVKLIAELIRQLALPPEAANAWPSGLVEGLRGRQLIVLVDSVDQADSQMREGLKALSDAGVRLLLVGRGEGFEDADVQFVDLPPFTSSESAAFLRQGAGANAARITDDLAAASHIAAGGWPGGLLDVLDGLPPIKPPPEPPPAPPTSQSDQNGVPAAQKKRPAAKSPTAEDVMRRKKSSLWPWLGAGALGLLLVGVLVFQDQINAMLVAPEPVAGATAESAIGEPRSLPGSAALPLPPPEVATPEPAERRPGVGGLDLAQADAASTAVDQGAQSEVPAEQGLAAEPGVPVIALPQLSRPAGQDEGSASLSIPDDPVSASKLSEAPPDQAAAAAASSADPLDIVSQDALDAADQAGAVVDIVESAPSGEPPGDASAQPPAIVAGIAPIEASAARAEDPESEPKSPAPRQQGNPDGSSERAEAVAAPVEDRSVVAPSAAVVEKPPNAGGSWLDSRPAERYTLQLVGARDRASVEQFIEDHGISPPFAIFERQLGGKPWYSLIAGDYPDRVAAVAARERLPAALKPSDIWPRTFASVQAAR